VRTSIEATPGPTVPTDPIDHLRRIRAEPALGPEWSTDMALGLYCRGADGGLMDLVKLNSHRGRSVALLVAFVVTAVGCESRSSSESTTSTTTTATAHETEPIGEPRVVRDRVTAPALAGNLLGDPAELDVAIRLPASYDTSSRRYPVVYFLEGYGEPTRVAPLGDALDDLVAAGSAPEMIIVSVSGQNAMGGSFYVDSPVTGNWSQAIHDDLVAHVDRTYRTIASRDSRGVAGFSMGGFGALDLAMRHADVFGAVYALSPGLFDDAGLGNSQMFDDPRTIEGFLAGQAELASAGDASPDEVRQVMSPDADVRFSAAYGMAFAPAPDAGPPWIDYPFESATGPGDDATWERWEAGFGAIDSEIVEFADELRSLHAIVVDVGTADEYAWIPDGCRHFAEAGARHDVAVRLETFDGGHGGIASRAHDVMWPMFAAALDA
jgi:S-formylglutathione hydrolase